MVNQSNVFDVVLVGFPGLPEKFFILVSAVMFLVYIISLVANGTVIGLVIMKEQLHQPMYVIIANLAASDLLFDTVTLPKIIAKYWFGSGSINFLVCIFQMFCVHHLGTLDSYTMMLMAMDRYVAICQPLRYATIITEKLAVVSCGLCWFVASFAPLVTVGLDLQISFCGRNKINNCFCTNIGVTSLSCDDITTTKQVVFGFAMIVLLVPLSFIIYSYVVIIKTIHLSTSSGNWQKAFYTCSTHLIVIMLYYTPRLFIYTANQVRLIVDADVNVLILCLYTYVPHLASPIIYCLRTKEIKQIFRKVLTKREKINTNHIVSPMIISRVDSSRKA
ncbi:olfactory receptor 56B34-like [Pelodytes ibericus]